MRIIEHISDLKAVLRTQKSAGKSVGLVPTMGSLHEGHLSLARMSKQDNDFTVMSLFVNPAQFGVNEDFDKYPRDIEGDSQKAATAGVDVLFVPQVKEMYPDGYNTFAEVLGITDKMCGKSRPGHFKGVTTVVLKLLNIVEPDKAYFGQKDAQQAAVIMKMVKDLNLSVVIIKCPIIREKDGLALSSRNSFLNSEERKAALILSKSLYEAEAMIKNGERSKKRIISSLTTRISSEELADIDYVEAVNAETLEDIKTIQGKVLLALAVKFGNTRLIDNIEVEV